MLYQFLRTASAAVLLHSVILGTAASSSFPGWRTPEAAVTAVLRALENSDEAALLGYCVTAEEYRSRIWPELPASSTRSKHLYDLVWSRHDIRNRQSIPRRIGEYGGRHFELLGITYREEKQTYRTIRIIPLQTLRVKDDSGAVREIRPLGTLYFRDGRYKIFSYYFD